MRRTLNAVIVGSNPTGAVFIFSLNTTIMAQPKFHIDRRPIAAINTYGAVYNKTPTGQGEWFYNEGGVTRLIEDRVLPLFEIGYRRFIVWLPAGSQRQKLMASSQWQPQPEYRKKEWYEVFKPWLASQPNIDFGIYGGFLIDDPYSLEMNEDRLRVPTTTNELNREWFRLSWSNWIELGMNWGRLDWAGRPEHRRDMVSLSNQFDVLGIDLGGEAIPTDTEMVDGVKIWNPDNYCIHRCPWICLHAYAAPRCATWNFDPFRTQIEVILSNHERDQYPITREVIDDYIDRGFVVGTMLKNNNDEDREINEYVFNQMTARNKSIMFKDPYSKYNKPIDI